MIWDRFDDAHDDLLDDIHAVDREITALKRKLKDAGIPVPDHEPPKDDDHGGGPQGWYESTGDELSAKESYRSKLRRLLDES